MKKTTLSLLAIPLALLGVVTSVALASSNITAPVAVITPNSSAAETVASTQIPAPDTDAETNDDKAVVGQKVDNGATDATETNDDVRGPQEAPDTETAD